MRMKPIAIFAALMLLFGVASAEVTANQPDDPALATVNGEDITKSQVDELIPTFVSYEFITDATDYRTVLDYLVQQKILTKKIEELGFDQFTAEEESAFSQEAQAQWDEALKEYADYNRAADTQEALEAALAQAEAYYAGQGMTLDKLVEHARTTASMNRLSQYLTGDNEPTEEEIQAMFEQFGPAYEQEYKDDIAKYEYMTQYAGQTSWYTPPGFRGVIHILLDAEDALLSNFNTLQKTFELQQEKTDAIHDELQEYLMSVKENEAFSAALASWKDENTIVYHQETIDQVISDALSQTVPEGPEDTVMAVDGIEEEAQTPDNGN